MKKSQVGKINKILPKLETFRETIGDILDSEVNAFESKSTKWQEGEKGEKLNSIIHELSNAVVSMDQLMEELTNAVDIATEEV